MTNQSERGGSGNFADDPQKASEAGRKGGQHSQSGGAPGSQKGGTSGTGGQQEQKDRTGGKQQGGDSGSFKDDPGKARDAGRKGGHQSHGGK